MDKRTVQITEKGSLLHVVVETLLTRRLRLDPGGLVGLGLRALGGFLGGALPGDLAITPQLALQARGGGVAARLAQVGGGLAQDGHARVERHAHLVAVERLHQLRDSGGARTHHTT